MRAILVSGGYLVDLLHFLRYLPSFVTFKRKFAKWRVTGLRLFYAPFERYKENLVSVATSHFSAKSIVTYTLLVP